MNTSNIKRNQYENHILEYWRKHYVFQIYIVSVAAITCLLLSARFVESGYAVAGFGCVVLAVAYLMIKETNESLQTRGEKIFWEKANALFTDVSFDYAVYHKEEDVPKVLENYTGVETYNLMRGNSFVLEEKWLYSSVRSNLLVKDIFRGVVLVVYVSEDDIDFEQIEKIKKIIGARKQIIQKDENKVSIWWETDAKLFHRYSLWHKNDFATFVGRIETIKSLVENVNSGRL